MDKSPADLGISNQSRNVVEWIAYEEADGKPEVFGGIGGWFGSDHPNTWQDYLDAWEQVVHPYIEAVKVDVLASGRFLNGAQHQNDPEGVPLFDDGTVATFSYRGWGDLMAAIAVARDGQPHNYMEFYC